MFNLLIKNCNLFWSILQTSGKEHRLNPTADIYYPIYNRLLWYSKCCTGSYCQSPLTPPFSLNQPSKAYLKSSFFSCKTSILFHILLIYYVNRLWKIWDGSLDWQQLIPKFSMLWKNATLFILGLWPTLKTPIQCCQQYGNSPTCKVEYMSRMYY